MEDIYKRSVLLYIKNDWTSLSIETLVVIES